MMEHTVHAVDDQTDGFMDTPVYLNQHVELLTGANNELMLFQNKSQKYIRISPFSTEVLNLMDGTRTPRDIAVILQDKYQMNDDIFDKIHQYMRTLRKAGVLNLDPIPEEGLKKITGHIADKPMLSLPLINSLDVLTNGLLSIYHLIPKTIRHYVWLIPISCALMAYVLFFSFGLSADFSQMKWVFLIVPVILFNLLVHEMAHAVVTKAYGISIREAGVALLYYFLPVAYVNRTDTYRLKEKKSRVHIALAGPYTDITLGGVWALVATVAPNETIAMLAQLIAFIQLMFVLNNMNLLLPTDGYHAVEALAGELSLRRKALHYFFTVLTFRKLPHHMQHVSKKRKTVYFTYSVVSVTYFLTLVAGVLFLLKNGFTIMG